MTRPVRRGRLVLATPALFSLLLLGAVGLSVPPETHPPGSGRAIDPQMFVESIDNPYLPLIPGTRFRFVGTGDDGREDVVTEVTHRTKRILGVETVVVRDTVRRRGRIVEQTTGWYAQDRAGNVWHFGEASRSLENGRPGAVDSWQAGENRARAGIIMMGRPEVGETYRQEFFAGEEEDVAQVLSLDQRARTPFGELSRLLVAKDYTRLEPGVVEHVFYARGIGVVLEVTVRGGRDHLALVSVTRP